MLICMSWNWLALFLVTTTASREQSSNFDRWYLFNMNISWSGVILGRMCLTAFSLLDIAKVCSYEQWNKSECLGYIFGDYTTLDYQSLLWESLLNTVTRRNKNWQSDAGEEVEICFQKPVTAHVPNGLVLRCESSLSSGISGKRFHCWSRAILAIQDSTLDQGNQSWCFPGSYWNSY